MTILQSLRGGRPIAEIAFKRAPKKLLAAVEQGQPQHVPSFWRQHADLCPVLMVLVLAACPPRRNDPVPSESRSGPPRPSELFCGKLWKNPNYPGERPGINKYLPTGVPDRELDLVSSKCETGCCREAEKTALGGGMYAEVAIPRGIVLERAEVRGWVLGGAGIHLPSGGGTHPATVENEITFDLQPDIDWKPDRPAGGGNPTPINSLDALLRYTSPFLPGENKDDKSPDYHNIMPPIRIHVEINGWGSRACRRPWPETFDAKRLCDFARANRPPGWNYEVFLHERVPALETPGVDYSDCHKLTDYNVALPGLSSWFPFNVLPQNEIASYDNSTYCVLQRTPDGKVRSTWDQSKGTWQPEVIQEGQYVRLVGTLWEDGSHNQKNCWNGDRSFSADRGWVEMHPVDELQFLTPPTYPRPGSVASSTGTAGMCDGTPLAGDPNKTRCIVQLCSAEGPTAPAVRRMPTLRWTPQGAKAGCRYKVNAILDNKSSTTSFTGCSSYNSNACETGTVSWDGTKGTEFILNATAIGVPGQKRGIVRAGYEITLDCCQRKCAGRCGGSDGCGGTCGAADCPDGTTCQQSTRRCVGVTSSDCKAKCEKDYQDCRRGCSGNPNCIKGCNQDHGACLGACGP
jgi:hypothetical protein